jgi:N-acetylglutamate synthase-like GNAT family acetyltransferase
MAARARTALQSANARPLHLVHPLKGALRARHAPLALRGGAAADADAIHALIIDHLAEGHLLPREHGEIAAHAHRFVVVLHGTTVVACAEIAPLSRRVAEVRSFVVSREARNHGAGRRMLEALLARALSAGFEQVCAFTHAPGYFVHRGFSLVPRAWVPEKIATDCHGCRLFRGCGQYAVVCSLPRVAHACVPLAALRG